MGGAAGGLAPVERIQRLVTARIRSGELCPGSAAPSTRRLASELGCNQTTVLRAYTRLAAEGLLAHSSGGFTVAIPDGPVATVPHPARASE